MLGLGSRQHRRSAEVLSMVSIGPGGIARALRVVLLSLTLALSAAPAGARELKMERFHSTIRVQADGSVIVRETLDVHFIGKWQHLYRSLPLRPPGSTTTQVFNLWAVTDGQGTPLRYDLSTSTQRAELKVQVPKAVDARKIIVLEYQLSDVVSSETVSWNVTGDEWKIPLLHVSAELLLPQGAEGIEAQSFTGERGSTQNRGVLKISAGRVAVEVAGALPPHQGLTLMASWTAPAPEPPALHVEPDPAPEFGLEQLLTSLSFHARPFRNFEKNGWLLCFPGGALMILFGLWCVYGRTRRPRRVVVQFTPPCDLTPAELTRFIGCAQRKRNIAATVLDLAVRGYIHIGKIDAMAKARADYSIERLDGEAAEVPLRYHERSVLDALRRRRSDFTRLRSLDRCLNLKNELLADELLLRGFYEAPPDRVRWGWVGMVAGPVPFVLIALLDKADRLPSSIAVLSAGAILCSFGWIWRPLTLEGARALEHALGFAKFLRGADPLRYPQELREAGIFERYLPYAIALGVEARWSEAFRRTAARPPTFPWCPGDLVELIDAINSKVCVRALAVLGAIGQWLEDHFPRWLVPSDFDSSSGSSSSSSSGEGSGSGGGGGDGD